LVKRPQCPCCGEPEYLSNKELQPLKLESCKKTFTKDGGHRNLSPEETLKKYQHHISSITGIVDKLKQSFDTNNGLIHAYSSGTNLALAHESLNSLYQSLRSRNAGKGISDCQAKVSCLCETLERYSGVFQGDEIRKKASYKQMGKSAIHPNACMNFSEEQYKNREKLNVNLSNGFHWVPVPFDEEVEIDWTPVWSLTYEEFKYLPTAYCYYSYPIPNEEKDFYHPCSNGSAAGNTLEEAILQGFLELVERDSVCLWWYNRIKRPAVNLESFEEPYISSLKEYYKTIQRELWVLDLTSDLNIPTFVAISRRTDKKTEDILLGFGAHFDPKIAILRAISELNQFLPAVLSITDDDSHEYYLQDVDVVNWWKTATLENQPYLAPDENTEQRVCLDYPQVGSDDLLKDVMTCVEIAKQNGMEMLVLDQTRPDVGLNVVKVIVPGMRHFWARFEPGRLYDVPVKLGWLQETLKEEQLNPIPLFA
jgi:ribosomal protein S12 methylthiotransferase accessory factor